MIRQESKLLCPTKTYHNTLAVQHSQLITVVWKIRKVFDKRDCCSSNELSEIERSRALVRRSSDASVTNSTTNLQQVDSRLYSESATYRTDALARERNKVGPVRLTAHASYDTIRYEMLF